MLLFKFTELPPHARMMAVTSLRVAQNKSLLRARRAVAKLKAAQEASKHTVGVDRKGMQAALTNRLKQEEYLITLLKRLGDDIECIQYLRSADLMFTPEGYLMERELWGAV